MALWGKLYEEPLSGEVTLLQDETTVNGANTAFTTELSLNDVIALDVLSTDRFRVTKIVSDTEMEVEPVSEETYLDVADATFSQVPKYLGLEDATQKATLLSVSDAQNPANRVVGLKTAGWNVSEQYVDQNGNTRNKVETLVALKS
jgi:hypothetical protein